MLKGSELIGKLVVTYDTGERIEKVWDLIFDQNNNQLLGFLVDEGGWFSSARVIPFRSVQALGPDAIVVPSKGVVVKAKRVPEIKQILKYNNVLKGTKIMTTNGRNLGTMVDLYFDEQTGVVEGYEVSGGLFADAYSGRSFVPAPQTLKIGEALAFVPLETANMMEEQVGGIRGAMQTAGGKLQETTDSASKGLQEAAQTASERLQETTESASQKLQEATRSATASLTNTVVDPAEQKAFVVGKTVNRDVTAPDGTLLVAQGQQVTLWMADLAEQEGVLDQLYRATGGSLTAELSRSVSDSLQTADGKLQETTESASKRLQETARTTSENLQETTDLVSERLQEVTRSAAASLTNTVVDPAEQKAFVVGKTVNQDVTAPDGVMLIAKGQQVTQLVAAVAETQGVLDQLYRAAGGSLMVGLSRPVSGILASRMFEQAKGRRLQRVVRTEEGLIIGAPGQIVTEQVIDRARTRHKEQELMDAVGLTTGEAVRYNADNVLLDTRLQLREGALQAQEGASSLWESIKQKVNDIQERSAKAIKARRIKQALGRPVTRVILDKQDNVILNTGELITHRAIEFAQQAKVLDILLSSVSTKQPEILKEELRALERGKASLEEQNLSV